MKRKHKIVICLSIPVLLVILAVILVYPWFTVSSDTIWTCLKCNSNREIYIEYGKWNAETNRQEVITLQGVGFESCDHKWIPGQSQINATNLQLPTSNHLNDIKPININDYQMPPSLEVEVE